MQLPLLPDNRSVAMLVMHFGHRDPEMHSHDATSYYAAIRPASAALHHYAVRHSSHNDFTLGCVACFARTTPGYRGLLDPAFGSPVSSHEAGYGKQSCRSSLINPESQSR